MAAQISSLVSETNENLLRVNLSKLFTDMEAELQKSLIEYWNDAGLLEGQLNLILAPIHEKQKEYYELLLSHKTQEFNRGADTGKRLVERARDTVAMKAAASKVPVTFTANENNLFGTKKYTENRLEQDTFTAAQTTLDRIDSDINIILRDGYKSGLGINHVSNQITQRFDQLRTWEATRIARTEIHTAQNMGIMKTYEDMGVSYTQWVSAKDSRVRSFKKGDRADHVEMDGQIIPFGGEYSNKLKFPGDKNGKIEEWINCRCTNAPFIMPPNKTAPPGASNFYERDLINISEPNYGDLLMTATDGQLNYLRFRNLLFTNNTPNVPPIVIPPVTDAIPEEVLIKLDKFGEQYETSKKEHLQFFTTTDSSEVAHGRKGEVKETGSQHRYLKEKAENNREVHATHNHPTDDSRKEGYTMFSFADFDSFVTWNIRGTIYDIPINMKTFSAENQYNRITLERLDNFHEVYKKGIRQKETLGRGTSYAIHRAVKHQEEFYDKYHPVVPPGMMYLRDKRKKLRENGVYTNNRDEYDRLMEEYKRKADEIDKAFFEERQKKFPELVEKMNKELIPYGMKITVKYKQGIYATSNIEQPKPVPKPPEPTTVKETPTREQLYKNLTADELNEYLSIKQTMDWADRIFKTGTDRQKKYAREQVRKYNERWQELTDKALGKTPKTTKRKTTKRKTKDKGIYEPKDTHITFEEIKTPQDIADYFGLEYSVEKTPQVDKAYDIMRGSDGRRYKIGGNPNKGTYHKFYDRENDCTLYFHKSLSKPDKNGTIYIDVTNSGKGIHDLKDVVQMYDYAPTILKQMNTSLTFGVRTSKRTHAFNSYFPKSWLDVLDNDSLNNHVTYGKDPVWIDFYKNHLETDVEMAHSLQFTMYHEMAHGRDFNPKVDTTGNGVLSGDRTEEGYAAVCKVQRNYNPKTKKVEKTNPNIADGLSSEYGVRYYNSTMEYSEDLADAIAMVSFRDIPNKENAITLPPDWSWRNRLPPLTFEEFIRKYPHKAKYLEGVLFED